MTRPQLWSLFLRIFACALIVAGVAVIYWPAALIVAGVLILIDRLT